MKNVKKNGATTKASREKAVLLGLIDHFLRSGRPVGSNTLKEEGFEHLSSATLRNYFSKLESEGLLEQQHISGGRIPTQKALRLYINEIQENIGTCPESLHLRQTLAEKENREVVSQVRQAMEALSFFCPAATFASTPRFDRDFVTDIRLMSLHPSQVLAILLTDFGAIHTEVIPLEHKTGTVAIKRLEDTLRAWVCRQREESEDVLTPEELVLAKKIYSEAMARFAVQYAHFTDEEIIKTGMAQLLHFPELCAPESLAETLALMENSGALRRITRDAMAHGTMRCWIGKELEAFSTYVGPTAVLAAPYAIGPHWVGAIALLGPLRMPYKRCMQGLLACAEGLSQSLTKSLYKFQLSYRQAPTPVQKITHIERMAIGEHKTLLIEG